MITVKHDQVTLRDINKVIENLTNENLQVQQYLLEKLRQQEEQIQATDTDPYWRKRDAQQEQQQRDKRAFDKRKIVKGPMFRHKPLGEYKQKIEELVDQLEENSQTILL